MLVVIARLAARHPWLIVLLFVLLTAASAVYGAGIQRELASTGLEDPTGEAIATRNALMEQLGVAEPSFMVVLGDGETSLDGRLDEVLTPMIDAVRADPTTSRVTSPMDAGQESLLSADKTRALVLIELRGDDKEQQAAFDRIEPLLRGASVPALVGGPLPAQRVAQELAVADLQRAELVALPIVAVLLLLFFRGPAAASLPLVIGVFCIPASFAALRFLTHFTEVSVFALNVGSFIGLGLAIDYALVLVQRFRDELAQGRSPEQAVERTLATSGRAIFVSGVTVAGSMLALLVFPLGILRTIAMAGSLVVAAAMLAALVLLPALLVLLAPRIANSAPLPDASAWHRIAVTVMKRPLPIMIGVLFVLAGLASPMLRIHTIMPDARTFPQGTDVRAVDELLDDPKAFGGADATPILALVQTEGSIITPESAAAVTLWAKAAAELEGVGSVDSPFATGPLTDPTIARTLLRTPALMPGPLRGALQATSKGNATVIRLTATAPWRSQQAADVVERLRALDTPGTTVLIGGPTAVVSDSRIAMAKDMPLAVAIVLAVNLLVLFVAFGSVVVPIKAVLMNIASIGASFGALVWVFQDGHLSGIIGFEPPGGVDLTVPVIMFAVVFGLSMDYEVFLLSRIREEFDRTGDNAHSVALGLERTGSIISRAAALLIVVVAGFATGRFLFVQELGVGMVVAIALDATLVRALLVPSSMALLGGANWWAPAPLRALWKRLGLELRED